MTTTEDRAATRREAQLVAYTLHGGVKIYKRSCWQCQQDFWCDMEIIHLCSDRCTSEFLLARGLVWYPEAEPDERWEFEPPAVVGANTLSVLRKWAEKVLALTSPDTSA